MYFCIALVTYWESVGFDTMNWRKSIDGTKAIVHERFANVLVDTINDPNVQRYLCPSNEFDTVMNSPEWYVEEPAV